VANRLYIILIAISVLFACSNREACELKNFKNSTISLSANLSIIQDKTIKPYHDRLFIKSLIIYYDSLTCGECQINHLYETVELFQLSDSLGNFKIYTIFSPSIDEYAELELNLINANFKYPLYIDFNNSFGKLNKTIPKDSRFHCFLVDANGHPVFVGYPLANKELWDLFIKALKNN